jgi:hypothetical protein
LTVLAPWNRECDDSVSGTMTIGPRSEGDVGLGDPFVQVREISRDDEAADSIMCTYFRLHPLMTEVDETCARVPETTQQLTRSGFVR